MSRAGHTGTVNAITNARLVLRDGVRPGTIVVKGGRIDRITSDRIDAVPGDGVIDAGGAYVLPGLIDSHVHFRTPGLTGKETWAAGSRAAVAGGVTTVIDMPNTSPHYTSTRDLGARIAMLEGQSLVDFAFHLGVTRDTIDSLADVDPSAVPSVKVFMAGHHTARHTITEVADLDQLFAVAARRGLLLTVHAEDQATLDLLTAGRPPPVTLADHERTFGRAAALVALGRLIERVRRYGNRVHVLHVSSAEEADLLAAAAAAGLPVTFEVTSHHLTFTTEDEVLGSLAKIRPAVRRPADRDRLWRAVLDGEVTTIGSDHAPHTSAEKAGPFADAPPGCPGVQELGPAFLAGLQSAAPTLSADERVALLVRVAADAPARLFGLSDRKGRLAEGFDADFVVLSLEPWTVTPTAAYAQCGWSPYAGRTLVGAPRLTLRRGDIVYDARTGCLEFGSTTGRHIAVRGW